VRRRPSHATPTSRTAMRSTISRLPSFGGHEIEQEASIAE
jgi:hypothetical protein